jgi:uncharacterized damage-inducible protein DinB
MGTVAKEFTTKSVSLLTRDYLPKLEQAVAALGEDGLWWRPNQASNSAGNLLLHLRGNVTQWIIGGVGGRPYERHRDGEFAARAGGNAAELLAALTATLHAACEIIAGQSDAALLEERRIQGYDVTVLAAIYHVVEHFSMHTGQIILIAKARSGMDLRLWAPVDAV